MKTLPTVPTVIRTPIPAVQLRPQETYITSLLKLNSIETAVHALPADETREGDVLWDTVLISLDRIIQRPRRRSEPQYRKMGRWRSSSVAFLDWLAMACIILRVSRSRRNRRN